uniref:Atrophin-1 n=1 Tax=Heterorhabditis bacteriophora TaxID=37862 RepID=A0A1I7WX89_HETBA
MGCIYHVINNVVGNHAILFSFAITRFGKYRCWILYNQYLDINISLPGRTDGLGGYAAAGCHPSTSHGVLSQPQTHGTRMAAATATWYPQHPQHGSGYLSAAVPMHRPTGPSGPPLAHLYPQPHGYPSPLAPVKPVSPYASYALNYIHQHSLARERENAYYRSRGLIPPHPPHSDWRHTPHPFGYALVDWTSLFALCLYIVAVYKAAWDYPYPDIRAGPPGQPPPGGFPPNHPAADPNLFVLVNCILKFTKYCSMITVLDTTSQAGSRAPSTGPPASAATPDSISRMSGGAELGDQRPGSAAAPPPVSTITSNSGPSSSQPSTRLFW